MFLPSHREGFICLDQLEPHGTDQRCCVEDVSFLYCCAKSLYCYFRIKHLTFLTNHFILHTRAEPRAESRLKTRFQNIRPSSTIIRHRCRSMLHRKPICHWRLHSREGSQSKYERLSNYKPQYSI